MLKKLAYVAFTTALAGGMALGSAGAASAAHCVEGDSPGFSYYGNDHVAQGEKHQAEGGNPGPHMGTSGASSCRDTTGSPSDRAPGQN